MKNKEKFEEILKELETIVKQLETGELSLEDSLNHFEKGIKLSKKCKKKLDEAEERINILIKSDDGELSEESFKNI
jgi:exodeoxyribonuclease VII small subunit